MKYGMRGKGRVVALTQEESLEKYGMEKLPGCPSERIKIVKPHLKSTGPVTPEGKVRVSMNNLKHGLCSQDLLVRLAAEKVQEDRVQEEMRRLFDNNALGQLLKVPGLREHVLDIAGVTEEEAAAAEARFAEAS